MHNILDFIAFDTTTPFTDEVKKQELSGIITSANTAPIPAPKTVLVYDRITGELIKTTNPIEDDSFLVKCPYRGDMTLTVVCRDEGGDYNADVYDRLSLCTVAYPFPTEMYTMLEYPSLFYQQIFIPYSKQPLTVPFIRDEQDHKGTITKFTITDNVVEYQDSSSLPIDVNYSKGMGVGRCGYTDNYTLRYVSELYVSPLDIFGDGSAEMLWVFDKDNTDDVSGNYSLFNAHTIYQRGMSDLGGSCISNAISGLNYDGRINFKYDYTPGPTTISFWAFLGKTLSSNSPILRLLGGFHVYTNSAGTYLYFQTASTNTAFNAAKNWAVPLLYRKVHIAITFGDGNYSLYINGLLASTQVGANTAAGLESGTLGFFDWDVWYNYTWAGSVQNFRIFNKVISAGEAVTLYEERLSPTGDIDKISGHHLTNGISSRDIVHTIGEIKPIASAGTLENHNNVALLMSFDCNSLGENSGIETVLDNISMFGDRVFSNGSGLLHKAPLSSDTSGNFSLGTESNIDILCRFKPTRTNADEILWKSGDSTNGLAIGIKSNAVGVFGASSGTLSSITMPVSNLTVGEWHYLYATDTDIILMNDMGHVINSISGTVTAANGTAQESVCGASEGSPMTSSSSGELEHFNGSVSDIVLNEHGSSLISESYLKIAACVEGSEDPCIIEEQSWDPINDSVVLWVTIPNLSSSVDNKIQLFLDKDHWNNTDVTYTGAAPAIPGGASTAWTDLRTDAEADIVASFEADITGSTPTLPGWSGKNKIQITLTPHTSNETNIPVRIHLTNTSEAGVRLMEALVKDGVFEYKRLAIEVGNTKTQAYAEVELASYVLSAKYPSTYDDTTVKAIDSYNANYLPWFAVDPSKSLTGSNAGTQWYSKATVAGTLERTSFKFNVDLGSMIQLKQLVLENSHFNGGSYMTERSYSVRKFKLYGSNDAAAFANLDYFDETDLTFLGSFHARMHILVDTSDPQIFDLEDNYLFFRYYILRIENGYSSWYMGFRDLDFIGVDATLDLNILLPTYSDVSNTILNLYPDITQADNTTYVDDPGEAAALEVWDHGYATAIDDQSRVSIAHTPVLLSDYVQRTWGNGKVVTMTIPASFVDANLTDFPFPVYLSTSAGTNTFDFSEWFTEMKENPILNGTEVRNYSFGSFGNKECGFYTDNMNFSADEAQNARGVFKFDNDVNKQIHIKCTDQTKFLSLNTSLTFWIDIDRELHSTSTYYGILGTEAFEGISVYLYYNRIYVSVGDGANKTTYYYSLLQKNCGPCIHVTISIRPYLTTSGHIEIKINGDTVGSTSVAYAPKVADFVIGGCTDRTDSFYGKIHSLQLWDKWLSDEEVKVLMAKNNYFCPVDTFSTSVLLSIVDKEILIGESLTSVQVLSENKFNDASFSFSFDRLTYQIYVDTAWIPIVSKSDLIHGDTGNTNWFYLSGAHGWVLSGSSLSTAISEAVKHWANWMNYSQVSALTQTEFDLEFSSLTGIMDIAVSVRGSDHLDDSLIDQIIINDSYTNTSEIFALDEYDGVITSSNISWRNTDYDGVHYNPIVSVFLDGDTSWTICTSNTMIPGITPGMATIGRSMLFKVEWPYNTPSFVDKNVTLSVVIK